MFLKICGRIIYLTVFFKCVYFSGFCLHVYAWLGTGTRKCKRRTSGPLGLELQWAVSLLSWVLRTELQPSARTAAAPHHWAVSLAFLLSFFMEKTSVKDEVLLVVSKSTHISFLKDAFMLLPLIIVKIVKTHKVGDLRFSFVQIVLKEDQCWNHET